MVSNVPKTVLTARVEVELKEQLKEEAAHYNMTLSNYTEHCLRHYNSVLNEAQVCDEKNQIMETRVNDLVSENGAMDYENQKNRDLNEQLVADNQLLSQQFMFHHSRAESLANQVSHLESLNKNQNVEIEDLMKTVQDVRQLNEEANDTIHLLNKELQSLKTQVKQQKENNDFLNTENNEVSKERDKLQRILQRRLPLNMLPEDIQNVKESLAELKNRHEDYDYSKLLSWSLATIVVNEDSTFVLYNLDDFKKRNPDFFTSKQLQE